MGKVGEVCGWVIFEITVIFHNKINSDLSKFGEQVLTDFPQLPVISTGEGRRVFKTYWVGLFQPGKASSA